MKRILMATSYNQVGPAPYPFGALLCSVSTYWSIAFIVLVELNYAIAPCILRRSHPQ